MQYCQKIKHAFDLKNFIYTARPLVCLNFDQNGFNLVRYDKCLSHQASVQLTNKILFSKRFKHYSIKRIDFFIIALQNKFRNEFRSLISLKTLGKSQNEIDHLNLRTSYSFFLRVIEQLLNNEPIFHGKVQQSL